MLDGEQKKMIKIFIKLKKKIRSGLSPYKFNVV